MKAQAQGLKQQARQLIDELPERASWEDLMYRIYVRESIEAGLADSKAGRLVSSEEVKRRFGLAE